MFGQLTSAPLNETGPVRLCLQAAVYAKLSHLATVKFIIWAYTFTLFLKSLNVQHDTSLTSVALIDIYLIGHFVMGPIYTLKTPGSAVTRKMVHWGQTPFRVNDDPEISQIDK